MEQEENENRKKPICDILKWVQIFSIRKCWGQEKKGSIQKKEWKKIDILNTGYFHRIKKIGEGENSSIGKRMGFTFSETS